MQEPNQQQCPEHLVTRLPGTVAEEDSRVSPLFGQEFLRIEGNLHKVAHYFELRDRATNKQAIRIVVSIRGDSSAMPLLPPADVGESSCAMSCFRGCIKGSCDANELMDRLYRRLVRLASVIQGNFPLLGGHPPESILHAAWIRLAQAIEKERPCHHFRLFLGLAATRFARCFSTWPCRSVDAHAS